jgi:hypothetical protein
MDLTVEVMLPPRGASDYTVSANPKWLVLAPVAVYPLKTVDVVGMPNTGYIHVTGIPEPDTWASLTTEQLMIKLNNVLCQLLEDAQGEIVQRRQWQGLSSSMSPPVRNKLLSDRQVTMSWNQFKSLMRHLVDVRNLTEADFE